MSRCDFRNWMIWPVTCQVGIGGYGKEKNVANEENDEYHRV